jgi:GNAT superfamily N-acetyltransferase
MTDKQKQTQGYLRENPTFFSGGNKLLAFIPEEYDLFYRVEHTMDGAYIFSFELEKMATIGDSHLKYTEETLGICESEITIDKELDDDGSKLAPGGLIYINWLFIEDDHRRKKLAYYLLYSVLLYAKSVGCDRIELVDGSGQSKTSDYDNIYRKICLHHVDHRELTSNIAMYASSHRSKRKKSYMIGNLDEVILRLEGDEKACGMKESIRGFAPENIKSNLGKRSRGQTRKRKRRSKRLHSNKNKRRSKTRRSRKRRSNLRSKRSHSNKNKRRSKRRHSNKNKRRSRRDRSNK